MATRGAATAGSGAGRNAPIPGGNKPMPNRPSTAQPILKEGPVTTVGRKGGKV